MNPFLANRLPWTIFWAGFRKKLLKLKIDECSVLYEGHVKIKQSFNVTVCMIIDIVLGFNCYYLTLDCGRYTPNFSPLNNFVGSIIHLYFFYKQSNGHILQYLYSLFEDKVRK